MQQKAVKYTDSVVDLQAGPGLLACPMSTAWQDPREMDASGVKWCDVFQQEKIILTGPQWRSKAAFNPPPFSETLMKWVGFSESQMSGSSCQGQLDSSLSINTKLCNSVAKVSTWSFQCQIKDNIGPVYNPVITQQKHSHLSVLYVDMLKCVYWKVCEACWCGLNSPINFDLQRTESLPLQRDDLSVA